MQEEESGLTVRRAQELYPSRFTTPIIQDPSTSSAQNPRRTPRSARPPTAISPGALERPPSLGEEPRMRSECAQYTILSDTIPVTGSTTMLPTSTTNDNGENHDANDHRVEQVRPCQSLRERTILGETVVLIWQWPVTRHVGWA